MKADRRIPSRTGIGLCLTWLLAITPPSMAQDEDDPAERKVMERFQGVLEKAPRRGTALDRVYGHHVEHGSLDALVGRYQDRTKADPADGPAWLLLGLIEAQRGHDASAVAALREAERLRPDDPLPPYYLGQALVLVGQPDASVDAFERALARRPSRVDLLEIYQALGRVHQRARRADRALAVWARLEAAFPDDNRVREQIAATLAEEDQPAQALARYESLARGVKDEYRKVRFALEAAELKVRLGRSPEALADFERILARLDPGSWLFKDVRRKVEDVFLRGDDLAGLARYYEAWIARTPDDVDAMARLGKTFAQLGRAADSRMWLDKAVTLAPSRRDLRLALIEQLAQEKKFAEASTQYEALVKAEPGNPDLIRDWGRLLLRDPSKTDGERKAAASAVWRRLVGDAVKDAVAVAQGADLFRSAELVDEAIVLYKRAIALAPDSAQYREYLGEYYHQMKRPDDALATWAGGPLKTAAEKGRLGEVMAGFGYRREALPQLADAVKLAPDDFELRLKLAGLLVALDRPADALAELAAAGKLADAPERAEAVLAREIAAHQAAGSLGREIASLQADLDAGRDTSAARWTRLARHLEADGRPNDAARAAAKATASDPRSVLAWATLGRLMEGSGNLGGAADANRQLSILDRRNRADYLASIARLEARLGRPKEALKAGRELLAAAPGDVEHHQEFAELCFGLGEVEEGLDALRRASRANPSDPKASNTLADALARQFRTEEAIELYWRAFERTRDLEGKLGLVSRLADQYLQRNQFDRLIGRLERELREPERRRELALCLAQAHQGAGDLGAARQQLESLLSANPRDPALLVQLSNLAEQEGDVQAAARHQEQAVEIAPTPEGTARLGNLHLQAGEVAEAEAVWSRLASADQDPARAFSAIDSLMAAGKYDTVFNLTERLLLKRPDDWDALYRAGVALANLGKPAEAAARFERVLALRANDDDLAALARVRRRGGPAAGPTGVQAARPSAYTQFPAHARRDAISSIRLAAGLDTRRTVLNRTFWAPADFGQARMAALAWLYAASNREPDPEAWAKARQAEAERPGGEARSLWDLYYLQSVRSSHRDEYAAAVRLARLLPDDPAAQYAFLFAMNNRDVNPIGVAVVAPPGGASGVDKTPPLPADEQALMLSSFESLRKRRPELVREFLVAAVIAELTRAGRDPDAEAFYRACFGSAATIEAAEAMFSVAAERGDVDGLLALIDRRDRLASAAGPNAQNPTGSIDARAIARAMGNKADEKDHAAILRMLDHHLAASTRPDRVAGRLKARGGPTVAAAMGSYQIYTSRNASGRPTSIDSITPNAYVDAGSIQVLRNAFEVFRKDDLDGDLVDRFRARAAQAEGDAKLIPTLVTSHLLWWLDERDESLKEYARAADLARSDDDLRLNLAELVARRGDPFEALEVADSVEPLDQKAMQRRELLAIRLAVLAGDVARARKAAERLFGFRLDADAQVELAAQMNQLGLRDLAEAVLARARRRSGGNASALVALMLQYQTQGKADVAVQVAGQILRQTGGSRQATANTVNAVNASNAAGQARAQAIQVLARSGKLKELIARAEAQLEASPTSQQLLQSLVDYYQADGQRDRVKAIYERLAALRPDDARLRLQVGVQLAQAGGFAEALRHYRAAIEKEPALLASQSLSIQRAFQQAGKSDELIKLYQEMDFKAFRSNPTLLRSTIQATLQNDRTREQGLALLRKAWKEMPESRSALISPIFDPSIWDLPEVYDHAREVLIPRDGRPLANPWLGLDLVNIYGQDGTVNTLATRLLDASGRQRKLDALAVEVEGALGLSPDWAGGRVLLAILESRLGKVEEARAGLEPLTKPDASVPMAARLVIAQELDKIEPLREVAIKVLEASNHGGLEELTFNGNGFNNGLRKRLTQLYQKAGRPQDARDLILKVARSPVDSSRYDPTTAAVQKVQQGIAMASMLQELGFPADSARIYNELANDTHSLDLAGQMFGRVQDPYSTQIADGLNMAIKGMNRESLARTLKTILTLKADAKPGEPRLDLVVLCHPRELDKAGVTCLFAAAIRGLKSSKAAEEAKKGREGLLVEAHATVERLVATYPDDLSVLAASALLAALDGDAETLAGPLDRLARWVEANPLEPMPASGRGKARRRAEASRRLVLWVLAREAIKHDVTRSAGEKLAALALDAARRQTDDRWTLAMLRESGQDALDRGDWPGAESIWRAMLERILTPPTAPRPPKPAGPDVPPASTARPVVTLERFEQASQLARLAADRGLIGISLDALRGALSGGPPIMPLALPVNSGTVRVVRRAGEPAQLDPVAQKVEESLFALDAAWTKGKADPVAVYEVYRDAVLPKARPGEVFLSTRPQAQGSGKLPRSVGALLVRRAVQAGKGDELKAAIEARQAVPLAAEPAKILLDQLEAERKNLKGSSKPLDAVGQGPARPPG